MNCFQYYFLFLLPVSPGMKRKWEDVPGMLIALPAVHAIIVKIAVFMAEHAVYVLQLRKSQNSKYIFRKAES